jgi:DNA polymerase-3 subunit delta'
MFAREQFPQALLLHGTAGSGRRLLALWIAARSLRIDPSTLLSLAEDNAESPTLGHPDLLIVRPDAKEKKTSIGIEQVREIRDFLSLTSHGGGRRVVLIWPADALGHEAANALLKTLEEPPPGSVIVLVLQRLTRLPATVISRCQRLVVRLPRRADAEAWLQAQTTDAVDWATLLDFCGCAPLLAKELHSQGFERQLETFRSDLRALDAGGDTPGAVAKRWAGIDPQAAVIWLQREASSRIRRLALQTDPASLQNPYKLPNMKHLHYLLRNMDHARRNAGKALNWELQLAALLQEWTRASLTR